MTIKKLGFCLFLTASFGLLACGDSSSGSNPDFIEECKFTDHNSNLFTIEIAGLSQKFEYLGDKYTFTQDYDGDLVTAEEIESACEDAKKESPESTITCKGSHISVTDVISADEFELLKAASKKTCEEFKGEAPLNPLDNDGE